MMGNWCKECAIKLPGGYGRQASGYFDVEESTQKEN
jgi:hypothetical protein